MPPLSSTSDDFLRANLWKLITLVAIVFFFLGAFAGSCSAQTPFQQDTATIYDKINLYKPGTSGPERITQVVNRLPTVAFDEDRPMETPHYTAAMPALPWEQARQCLMALHNPKDTLPDEWERIPRPTLIVITAAASLIIHDHTLQAMADQDSSAVPYYLPGNQGSFDAYSLIYSHAIVVLDQLKDNERTLRHESLHFWLWYTRGAYGHPKDAFDACDKNYVPRPTADSTMETK